MNNISVNDIFTHMYVQIYTFYVAMLVIIHYTLPVMFVNGRMKIYTPLKHTLK